MKRYSQAKNFTRSKKICYDFLSDQKLFDGVFLNWTYLKQSEKVVCLGIVLIPLWWLWGWSYLLLLLGCGICAYEIWKTGSISLKNPSLIVVALIAYGLYDLIGTIFYGLYNNSSLGARDFLGSSDKIFSPAFMIWYIQSKGIRVRSKIVAWAFSFVVIMMIGSWAYIFLINQQISFEPPRSLFGFLTGKPSTYVIGAGNTNYLIPYRAQDSSIAGFARYFYFFHGPESLALTCGFICLLAVEIESKIWKALLFSGSFFILLTSGTRSVWLSLPLVLFIWFLFASTQTKSSWLVFALIAIASAIMLMMPPATNFALDKISGTAEATSEFRGDSTDTRAEIYKQTYEKIVTSSNMTLLLGHVVPGETVLPGYAPAKIGTHSFYLGSLLYIRGVVGTAIFLTYWVSLIRWVFKTRNGRPSGLLMMLMLFSLTFSVMALESVAMPITLIIFVTRDSKTSPLIRFNAG